MNIWFQDSDLNQGGAFLDLAIVGGVTTYAPFVAVSGAVERFGPLDERRADAVQPEQALFCNATSGRLFVKVKSRNRRLCHSAHADHVADI